MSATSGGLDSQPVAGPEGARRLRRQLLAVQRGSYPARRARRPRRPGGACRRRSVISEKRISASASSSRTTPSPPRWRAGAARAAPQRVLDGPQRELQLERLDRRVERVRHRHVHGARAVGVRAGALAAAERLVVGEVVVAEREVVHRALAERVAEGGQHEVGHARRGLDVARPPRRRAAARSAASPRARSP